MRVLHINQYLLRKGGVETYLFGLLPLLAERGVDQRIVYAEGDASTFPDSHRIPEVGMASFGAHDSVRRQLRIVLEQERPDVIHVHNIHNVAALETCLAYGPTVLHTHDHRWICPASSFFQRRTQEVCGRVCGPGCLAVTVRKHCLTPRPKYAAYYLYRGQWAKGNTSRFARVVAPCADAKHRLMQAGFEDGRIEVLPYFCPIEPLATPRPIPERTQITYIGRIAPNKGHEFFVRALGELPPDVHGVMVGSFTAEAEREVMQLATKAGCADRLKLRKWASREEVLQILDATSVFIFPSLWPETLGIVGIEALSRGVPVVGSDLGGVREWLYHRENGMLVSPKSASQIRDAVLELTASKDTLLAFGAQALSTIRQKFMPAQHVDALLGMYEAATRTVLHPAA